MDERLQFVAHRLAGEPMAELCREFGISRKAGCKIFDRYRECGVQGLTDRDAASFGKGKSRKNPTFAKKNKTANGNPSFYGPKLI
jgi:hypothetical protein